MAISIQPVWTEKFYIGTSYTSSSWVYSQLCEGIESIEPSVNEQNQQYFFMCGNGGADNEVTGIAPEYAVSGRRVIGNAAQDYIVSKRYSLGDERKSSMKVEIYNGTSLYETITADCTITDIVDFGGATTDNEPFSCTLRVNGIPTVTPTN